MSEDRRIAMRLTKIESTLEEIKRSITMPEPPDRPITVREAAEIMHCSDQRIRDSIRDGTLRAERNGRRYYLSLHDVMARAGFHALEKKTADLILLILKNKVMTTRQIREIDSRCLNDYLSTLPQTDRRFFVTAVVRACGQGIKRKTFYNWKAGCCCIPSFCKAEIEKIAGCVVFPKELYVTDKSEIPVRTAGLEDSGGAS